MTVSGQKRYKSEWHLFSVLLEMKNDSLLKLKISINYELYSEKDTKNGL